jgi:hypothetical protein
LTRKKATIIDWTGDPERLSLGHSSSNPDVMAIHTMFCRYRIHRLSVKSLSRNRLSTEQNPVATGVVSLAKNIKFAPAESYA